MFPPIRRTRSSKGDEELMHVGDEFVPIESDLSLANRLIDVTQFD